MSLKTKGMFSPSGLRSCFLLSLPRAEGPWLGELLAHLGRKTGISWGFAIWCCITTYARSDPSFIVNVRRRHGLFDDSKTVPPKLKNGSANPRLQTISPTVETA